MRRIANDEEFTYLNGNNPNPVKRCKTHGILKVKKAILRTTRDDHGSFVYKNEMFVIIPNPHYSVNNFNIYRYVRSKGSFGNKCQIQYINV